MAPPNSISLTGIFVYPVKSLRGVALNEAVVVGHRLRGDREWLLLDPDNRFLHQRDYPQMARIRVTPTADGLALGAAGQRDLVVTRPSPDASVEYVRLWRRLAPVRHVTGSADAWLTAALGVAARLMAFAPEVASLEGPSWEADASLQDATPFHLTSQDSLDDLNRRIGEPIPMNRFRPNLVVSGAAPYAEDAWQDVRIGPISLRWIKPCTRCKLTMTDQETGQRPSGEPLRTLATYRRVGSEVVFGHYFTAGGNGDLRLGDQLQVLRTHDSAVAR
jgi:uncharacterized protein YcbX